MMVEYITDWGFTDDSVVVGVANAIELSIASIMINDR
jgi:hypothetical protein